MVLLQYCCGNIIGAGHEKSDIGSAFEEVRAGSEARARLRAPESRELSRFLTLLPNTSSFLAVFLRKSNKL
ncbi:MAG TPA: hypothetical protein VF861_06615 [Telluria sp.]